MTLQEKINLLITHIDTLPDFKIVSPDYPYNHMGATIVDAMLQAGLKYATVVEPRVKKLRSTYSEAKTTSGFLGLLEKSSLNELINWKHPEKIHRILEVARFLAKERIETEEQLKIWLSNESNVERFKEIRGIGNKTADYFKMLSGIPTSAIDRHLINFVNRAGISTQGYFDVQEIINGVAEQKGINKVVFDYSIWKYMSEEKNNARLCKH
ncbi:MAG: hypothetical protein ABIF85_04695 [Nanoarchaeota archaeon]|nr:hypothetical protein [Nanoarchaeota archaeon]MBU4300994.1 hypothetical protein [Nanoarchaeota archaeon]MBU4452445.1 hypothetical protein [Nanoarchaeota archaeon]MCG2723975.1 hypothetical protein [archaeon]